MQLDQIQWVYKLALVAERLLGRLPPSLAWIFLSGAIMIGIFYTVRMDCRPIHLSRRRHISNS